MGLTGFNRARRERAKREVEALQGADEQAEHTERPLAKLKKYELLFLASERGIAVDAKATKAKIVEALQGADEQAE